MSRESSYAKGKEFENRFGEFMKSDLDFDKIKPRTFLSSTINPKGSEVDIVGVRKDDRGKFFNVIAGVTMLVAVLLLLYGFYEAWLWYDDIWMIDPIYTSTMLGLEAIAIIYLILGANKFDKYTWVECKAWSKKVPIKEVRDCYHRYQEYNQSKDRKHTCHEMIFVSKSGFVANAIDYANEKGVKLYVESEDGFESVKEWV